jgi:hypothetical protein
MFDAVSAFKKIGKYISVCMLILSFVSLAQGQPPSGGSGTQIASASAITSAMLNLCTTAKTFLSVGAMLLIVLAAAVYAIGQILGAETRARASVWATAMITGAVIGIVIYLIVPALIGTMMSGSGASSVTC